MYVDCSDVSSDHCGVRQAVTVCHVPAATHQHTGLPDNGDPSNNTSMSTECPDLSNSHT